MTDRKYRLVTRADFDGIVCGGHAGAGTCRIPTEDAGRVLSEIVARINAEG